MTLYASHSAKGFFHAALHGARTRHIPDPSWVRPNVQVHDPDWVRPVRTLRVVTINGADYVLERGEKAPEGARVEKRRIPDLGAKHPLIEVPDRSAKHPTIEVDNPDCRLPADAVEISAEQHQALLAGQAAGKVIVFGPEGPYLDDPSAPSVEQQLARLRDTRDARLKACDWTQLADADLSAEQLAAWRAYRQQLRDLPATADLDQVAWPTPPA